MLFCANYVKLIHKGPHGRWLFFIDYLQIRECMFYKILYRILFKYLLMTFNFSLLPFSTNSTLNEI